MNKLRNWHKWASLSPAVAKTPDYWHVVLWAKENKNEQSSTTIFRSECDKCRFGIFKQDIQKQQAPVTQVSWQPIAGGNKAVIDALDKLAQPEVADKIESANEEAVTRIINSHPVLVGYERAIDAVPGMTKLQSFTQVHRLHGKIWMAQCAVRWQVRWFLKALLAT